MIIGYQANSVQVDSSMDKNMQFLTGRRYFVLYTIHFPDKVRFSVQRGVLISGVTFGTFTKCT